MNHLEKLIPNFLNQIKKRNRSRFDVTIKSILKHTLDTVCLDSKILNEFIFDGSDYLTRVINQRNVTKNQLVDIAKIIMKPRSKLGDMEKEKLFTAMVKVSPKILSSIIRTKEFKDSLKGISYYHKRICKSDKLTHADLEYLVGLNNNLHESLLEINKLKSKHIDYIAKLSSKHHYDICVHPNASPNILDYIAKKPGWYNKKRVLDNRNTSSKTLKFIASFFNVHTVNKLGQFAAWLLSHRNICSDSIELIYDRNLDPNKNKHLFAHGAHSTRAEKISRYYDKLTLIAKNPKTPTRIIDILAKSRSEYVRCAALSNPSISVELLKDRWSRTKSSGIKQSIMQNNSTPIEILEQAWKEKYNILWGNCRIGPSYLHGSCENPNLTSSLINHIVKNIKKYSLKWSATSPLTTYRYSEIFNGCVSLLDHPEITKSSKDTLFNIIIKKIFTFRAIWHNSQDINLAIRFINNPNVTSTMIDDTMSVIKDNGAFPKPMKWPESYRKKFIKSILHNDRLSTASIFYLHSEFNDSIPEDNGYSYHNSWKDARIDVIEMFKNHPSIKGLKSEKRIIELESMHDLGLSSIGGSDVELEELDLKEL